MDLLLSITKYDLKIFGKNIGIKYLETKLMNLLLTLQIRMSREAFSHILLVQKLQGIQSPELAIWTKPIIIERNMNT